MLAAIYTPTSPKGSPAEAWHRLSDIPALHPLLTVSLHLLGELPAGTRVRRALQVEAAAWAKALKGDVAVWHLVGGGYPLVLRTEKSQEAWRAEVG